MRFVLIILLLSPQLAAADVFMCTDPQTGRKTFTDRACEETASREQLRVEAANTTSGARTGRGGGNKTWNSERDETRTGRDYREEERVHSSAASNDGSFNRTGYLGDSY